MPSRAQASALRSDSASPWSWDEWPRPLLDRTYRLVLQAMVAAIQETEAYDRHVSHIVMGTEAGNMWRAYHRLHHQERMSPFDRTSIGELYGIPVRIDGVLERRVSGDDGIRSDIRFISDRVGESRRCRLIVSNNPDAFRYTVRVIGSDNQVESFNVSHQAFLGMQMERERDIERMEEQAQNPAVSVSAVEAMQTGDWDAVEKKVQPQQGLTELQIAWLT
jgi:hypothetical protein